MQRLIYASRTDHRWSDDELIYLLDEARSSNHRGGVTGLLLYCDQTFLQLLEGAPEAVATTYARIVLDERHSDIRVLERSEVEEQSFPTWSMGFRAVESDALATVLPGYRAVLGEALIPADLITSGVFALEVLQHFARHG